MKDHDKTAFRLGKILTLLNDGKTLTPNDLAEEFKVSVRTIQRDLKSAWATCLYPLRAAIILWNRSILEN